LIGLLPLATFWVDFVGPTHSSHHPIAGAAGSGLEFLRAWESGWMCLSVDTAMIEEIIYGLNASSINPHFLTASRIFVQSYQKPPTQPCIINNVHRAACIANCILASSTNFCQSQSLWFIPNFPTSGSASASLMVVRAVLHATPA